MTITAVYVHPQGKRVEVHSNGALVCTKNGKKATTSATAEKLAAGYGGWTLVEGDVEQAAADVALPAAKAVSRVLRPMRFAEAPVADLPSYVNDPAWALQQKLDGVRAQIVFSVDAPPWLRNSSGERLVNSAVAPTVNAIMRALDAQVGANLVVDGEIVGGAFYAFDLVVEGAEAQPYRDRLAGLASFLAVVTAMTSGLVRPLRTAVSQDEKFNLASAVLAEGGEGWIAKRLDSPYEFGARVSHSLKLKVTSTIDCVVIEKDPTKDAVRLGCYDEVGLVEVGRASLIGKGDLRAGDVVEVKYLYASADGRLTQPTILRRRTDKAPGDCTTSQLRFVNKKVIA